MKESKIILITTPWFHPAFKAGGPIQSIANLVNTFNEDINYFIYSSNCDLNNTNLEVETGKWIRYNEHTQVWYAEPAKRSETLVKLVEKNQPDIIYIVGIFSWHFNLVPLLFSKAPHKIISVRGMLHPGALSQKKSKKQIFLSLWKFFDWHRKAVFHASDQQEAEYIEKVFGDEIRIEIAKNFPRKFDRDIVVKKQGQLKLVSLALISPMKNHLLVLQSFAHTPTILEYHIAGPVKDMVYWQQCLEQMKQLPVNIAVDYLGEVPPAQVENILHKGQVFILPSKSENFGHAIYEALSAGKPVITSHHVPWLALEENKAGMNVELDEGAVAKAIMFFAEMRQEEFDVWSEGAVRYANERINVEQIKEEYRNMFKNGTIGT